MNETLPQNDSGDPARRCGERRGVFLVSPLPRQARRWFERNFNKYEQSYRTKFCEFPLDEVCLDKPFIIDVDDYHVLVTILLSFGIRGFRTIDLHMRAIVNYWDKTLDTEDSDDGLSDDDLSVPGGVSVHEWKRGGRIASLRLEGYYTRSLPSSIGRLDGLEFLDLCHMPTLKSLPEEIGHLTNLRCFLCQNSEELVSLPESIGCLSNLRVLSFHGCCKVKSLPKSIGCLTNLGDLDLGFMTSLETLPEEIGNLTNLEELEVYGTRIETLPNSIGQLKKLKRLDLSHTRLRELPETIGDLINLEELNLESSMISSLPRSIGRLRNLKTLNLEFVGAFCELPDTIGGLEHLKKIVLRENRISSLPDSFAQLQCLQSIDLSRTEISSLPDSFSQLKCLESLNLSRTEISSLPDTIGGLERLDTLDLNDTKISSLPDSFAQLKRLESVDMSRTEISSLPNYFLHFECLEHLLLIDTKVPEPDLAEITLMLLKRIPLLYNTHSAGSHSQRTTIDFFNKINETKLRSLFVARSETSTKMNPKLWPHVLVKAMAWADDWRNGIVERRDEEIQMFLDGFEFSDRWNFDDGECIPNQTDFIYQLLVDGRESFLDTLRDMNC